MIFRKNEHIKMLDNLGLYINSLIERNQYLQEQLNDFRKDDEIKKLEEENSRLRVDSVAILNEKERVAAKAFREKHYTKCKSGISYIIHPNGLGDTIKVQCTFCKETENITDVDNW